MPSPDLSEAIRAALLTGLYPIHTGMYHGTVKADTPWGLPLEFTLLPEWLKRAGNYSTHAVGKWVRARRAPRAARAALPPRPRA